jgi:FkbM family methyltransferase
MTFVSYAQNFEDVMLWRALRHVEHGFYLDIGAQDPVIDSVSLAFYERGWRGCHVEPTLQYFSRLQQARPDEMVLQVAVGKEDGFLNFFEFENSGLSTSDPEIANSHRSKGFACRETTVPAISLKNLLQRLGDRDIHWMKIDVEGGEQAVIEGWSDSPVRPWILVIESTRPLTQDDNSAAWLELVLSKGYKFVYFDGLNRFYVSERHSELQSSFAVPPNIFDDFVLSGTASQPFCRHLEARAREQEQRALAAESNALAEAQHAQAAETRAREQEQRALAAESNALAEEQRALAAELNALAEAQRALAAETTTHHWWHEAKEWQEQVIALHKSTSWKITKPLRAIKRLASGDFSLFSRWTAAVSLNAKQTFRPVVAAGIRHVFQRPRLRARFSYLLKQFPWLHQRLLRVAVNTGAICGGAAIAAQQATVVLQPLVNTASVVPQNMSRRARQIYKDLKVTVEKRKMEKR